jgi:hypothetical protein
MASGSGTAEQLLLIDPRIDIGINPRDTGKA